MRAVDRLLRAVADSNSFVTFPYFPQEIVDRCEKSDEEIDSVFDIMSLEDDTRDKLLQLEPAKMAAVATYAFRFVSLLVTTRHG